MAVEKENNLYEDGAKRTKTKRANHSCLRLSDWLWIMERTILKPITKHRTRCISAAVLEPRTATGSELFSFSTFLYTSTFILLRIFSLVETTGSNSGRDHCPGMLNHHFRFPSVVQSVQNSKTLVIEWDYHLTAKIASAQVVETSVTNNSPSRDSNHPDDLFQ